MTRLTVRDVMTSEVIAVRADASFKNVARLLSLNSISALPVLDDEGHLVGVVSEADLLPKEGHREDTVGRRLLATPARRHERAKAAGESVRDVMSFPAVTIGPDATLAEAARAMITEGVKRLPVVTESGKVVGIVSRADLVKTFLRPDEAIAEDVRSNIAERIMLTERGSVDIKVSDGIVTLSGHVDRRTSVDLAEKIARGVDGVVEVTNGLTHRWDDTKIAR